MIVEMWRLVGVFSRFGGYKFLTGYFANLTFEYFKLHYLDEEECEDNIVPNFHEYLGTDLNSEGICLSNIDNMIYTFGYGNAESPPYYGGLKELLFYYLFRYIDGNIFFNVYKFNINIENIEKFKSKYLDYEIKDIHIYNRYFFKDNQLIICDHEFYSYNIYCGGILDKIVDDR